MKKFLFLLLVACHANAQDILWEKSYGGKNSEYLFDAISTPDYGFILAGSSISNKGGNKSEDTKGNFDYWIWKMNEKGDVEWQKNFGGSKDDFLYSIQVTKDGGFILAGSSYSDSDGDKKGKNKGECDFWIVKLDAKGGEQWQQTIGGSGVDRLQSIRNTLDGGYIIGGTSNSEKSVADKNGTIDIYSKKDPCKGNLDYWIVKLDKQGKLNWQKTFGGIYVDELKAVEQNKAGEFIVAGYSNSPKSEDKTQDNYGDDDYWVLKLDVQGNVIWQKTIGGNKADNLFALQLTQDGGFVIGGSSSSESNNSKIKGNGKGVDFWIIKFDAEDSIEWQETYDFGKSDVLTSLVENKDGSLLIGGYAQSEKNQLTKSKKLASDTEGINDYIALKINKNGEKLWSKTVGSKEDDILQKLIETRDGGYVLAGTSDGDKSKDKSSKIGATDFWVVKLKDKLKLEKEKIGLEAMPNPTNAFTNVIVNYYYSYGSVSLYDINGKEVYKKQINGERTIPVDLSNLSQGIYIIKIKSNIAENAVKIIKK